MKKYTAKQKLYIYAGGAFVLLLLILLIGKLTYTSLRQGMPSIEQLENFEPQLSTKLLDRNGEVIKELYTQRRYYVPLKDISPWVVMAVLSIEDHKFYQHWGIRPWALFAAVGEGIVKFDFHFRGASTITQQLARNLYYTSQRKMMRKVREAITAVEIEKHYSKDEILEMYLTQTYFGSGSYGIGAASNTYFSKFPKDLTIEEAATIAAIPKSPTRYNPQTAPENSLARRNIVLARMHELGYLSTAVYDSVKKIPLKLKPGTEHGSLGTAPYFTENVRQLLNDLGKSHNFDPYGDGMVVHTTLDARLQRCAEAAVQKTLPDLQKKVNIIFRNHGLNDYLNTNFPDSSVKARRKMATDQKFVDSIAQIQMPVQVAFVVLDPTTGGILAMVGGRDFEESKFNRATQAVRQPGSSFKPIVYTTCLDKGVPICTKISNEPIVVKLATGGTWTPHNFEGTFGGEVDLREGLKKSLNMVSVRLIREFTTPGDVAKLGHKLGITTQLDPFDALALGSSGVIPLEMASVYQVFQTLGIYSKPMYITSVEDAQRQSVAQFRPDRNIVLSEQTAFLTQSLLRTVVDNGTGAGLRSTYGFRRPAGGKTGTTNDYTDAWFDGFTPHMVAVCWVGLDDPAKSLGRGQEGSKTALPIWGRFMVSAYDSVDFPAADFKVPAGIVTAQICEDSGQLATANCVNVRTEYFNRKFPLPDNCTKHAGAKATKKRRPSLF